MKTAISCLCSQLVTAVQSRGLWGYICCSTCPCIFLAQWHLFVQINISAVQVVYHLSLPGFQPAAQFGRSSWAVCSKTTGTNLCLDVRGFQPAAQFGRSSWAVCSKTTGTNLCHSSVDLLEQFVPRPPAPTFVWTFVDKSLGTVTLSLLQNFDQNFVMFLCKALIIHAAARDVIVVWQLSLSTNNLLPDFSFFAVTAFT